MNNLEDISDRSNNDVTIFEQVYSSWLDDIDDTIKSYLCKKSDEYSNVNNDVIDSACRKSQSYWKDMITSQETKFDIIMWLKATAYTYNEQEDKDKMTLSEMKSLFDMDSNRKSMFNNGKKRLHDYYVDELFTVPMPIYYYLVYGNSPNKNNPFSRKKTDISLSDYWLLYDELFELSSSIIESISNPQMRDCQSIVNRYYLENAYGFCIKSTLAKELSKNINTNDIYCPEFVDKVKGDVLYSLYKNDSFNIELPEKYSNLKPSDFHKFFGFLSESEKNLLSISLYTNHEKVPDELFCEENKNKGLPDPGYILMYLLYGKKICQELLCRIPYKDPLTLLNVHRTDLDTAHMDSRDIVLKLQKIIDCVIKNFDLSVPGDNKYTDDERYLLYGIKDVIKEIPETNSGYKEAPNFGCKVNATVFNSDIGESIPLHDMVFAKDEIPIVITMPSENNTLNRFISHCEKAYIYKMNNKRLDDMTGLESRTFKNVIVALINNCFHVPTRAKHNPSNPRFNYVLQKLDVKDHSIDRAYNFYKGLNDITHSKGHGFYLPSIAIKLLQKAVIYDITQLQLNQMLFEIIDECLSNLYEHLVSSIFFKTYDDYKKYITSIYNTEVLEHIETTFPDFKKLDTSKLSSDIQNRIARL